MLLYLAIIAAVLILAVVLRFHAEPDEPDNGITHVQEDGKRDGGSEPDEEPPDRPDDVALTEPLAA